MGNLTFEDGRLVGKRGLRFSTLDDFIAEAEQLLSNGYDAVGDWTLAQNCEHLTRTINFSIDGFPMKLNFFMKNLVKLIVSKDKLFREGFKPGIKLKGQFSVMVPPENIDDAAAVNDLREAITRFKSSNTTQPSPILGPMSFDDWTTFHLRHGEHHLGMLRPHKH